jgi:hypothetical protein
MLLTACGMIFPSQDDGLESTRVALAIQQTSLALSQAGGQEAQPPAVVQEKQAVQPTYTAYPTYTVQVVEQPPEPEPEQTEEPEPEAEPAESFEDWLDGVNILIYDDMWGSGEPKLAEDALDALGLGKNTTNVNDAMGHLMANMNSAVDWDLIIIIAEDHDAISGEYFDLVGDELDRGTSIIIELWYMNEISSGRIQPVMQRCGIAYQKNWERSGASNLNDYLIYLLDPTDPVFSEPNLISMLIPFDVYWVGDVGDRVKLVPGSDAVLLAGTLPKEYSSYGVITKCLDGRMIWQTFCSHDYKTQDMINLWQNYIKNTLKARYEYLND